MVVKSMVVEVVLWLLLLWVDVLVLGMLPSCEQWSTR
jgi:hypothetical protein